MKDKMSKVSTLASDTQTLYDERLKALEQAHDAGDKFWSGLDEIKHILKDVQDHLDSEEPPAADLEVLEEQIHDHQVRILPAQWDEKFEALSSSHTTGPALSRHLGSDLTQSMRL